ncbi:MAG: CNP1-like family protein [Chromatiales bacterium]|jgi:hypothetical protein
MVFTLPLMAKDRPLLDEPDNTFSQGHDEYEWQEKSIRLPQSYREEDLQEFHVDDASGRFSYFIDRSSLQTDADGVSRLTLVIRSKNGVDNSSYEGFHCGSREYKVYAYGTRQGFKAMPKPSWQRISRSGRENYRNVLYNNLLCNLNTGKPNPPQAVIRAMRQRSTVNNSPLLQD